MDYKEACHRLRITPALLKWFTRYSPKNDGTKLVEAVPGDFDRADLDAFDSYMRMAWRSKNIPLGIQAELRVEARGRCALCDDPCEKLQLAHIRRKGVEVNHHFQHPENLIPLCGTCHDRYDDPHLKEITLEVVCAAKERLTSRKMEAIDRDVERARMVREAVESVKVDLSAKLAALTGLPPDGSTLWSAGAADLLTAVAQGIFGGPHSISAIDPTSPSDSLVRLRDSLEPPGAVTQAVLGGYAQEATGAFTDSEWDMIEYEPPEYECICGDLKDTVDYECLNCGHAGSNLEVPSRVEDGVPYYEDARGDSEEPLSCEKCSSENLETSYPEQYCSRCRYKFEND
jgi:hypothetical protein